jgi:hypothetical protein
MHVVAIAALDQPFVHSMMERHIELGSLLEMAPVTKRGLRFDQQKFFCFRVMRRMARNAADIVPGMLRVNGIHVLRATGMARQAASVDLFGRVIFEDKYFGNVPPARDVRRSRTMATLASLVRRAVFRVERRLPVRCRFPVLVDVCVASLAGF